MSLVCALSNEVPEHPVLSPASGCIFERRLIEKYLDEKETDPITGDVLTPDMLIEVKTITTASQNHPLVIKPRPPSATSIPALLKCLQDEWDAVMLNSFTLRQQLQTTRQELSHALYQHDAACRVIARLNKEVAAAREALATLKPQTQAQISNALTGASNGEIMDIEKSQEELGLTEKVIQKLQDKASQLTSERKKRVKTMPEDLTKPDAMKLFKQASSHLGLHSASSPGILSLDIFTVDSSKILTGGNDKNAVVFDKETNQVIATLKGHTKKVSSVVYHNQNNVALTASPDQTIRVWDVSKQSCSQIIKAHDGAVTGISLHPTGDYVLSSSLDEHWSFADISTGKVLCKVADANNSSPLTCIQFHPDGLIFGTGTQDAMIKIWDLKEKSNVANFPGHSGAITALAFSENGYYLATSADDSIVKLWDLRKLKNFKTIPMDEENNKYEIRSLTFDYSGNYLAVAGTDVRVYLSKQWQELCCLKDHTAIATGVKFGPNATFLASTSMDRSLKFYSE